MAITTSIDIDHIDFLIRLFNATQKFSQLSATKQKLSIYLQQKNLVRFGTLNDDQQDLVFLTDKGRNLIVELTRQASEYVEVHS
jgi:hypothetical protein